MTTTCTNKYSANGPMLYLAFELSSKEWKLGFTTGLGQRPRTRNIPARNLEALQREIEHARVRFRLPKDTSVVSCYEAGRDGFWLHRFLMQIGVENLIVDSASIEVNRRRRRAKTDKLDVEKLLTMLIRYCYGEQTVWRVVTVPSVEQEDNRQLHRDLKTLKKERTMHINRMKGLLASQGVRMQIRADFPEQLAAVRLWDGSSVPPAMQARLMREHQRMMLLNEQVAAIDQERRDLLRNSTRADVQMVRDLMRLKAIAANSAWLFTMEFFAWRKFCNQKEVGALSGFVPTPSQSGSAYREQGISKAGNRYVRGMAVEIAWKWVQHQPDSKLTRWFEERYAHGGSRMRRIGITAVARKLLIELWRYLETGEIPEGARLKA